MCKTISVSELLTFSRDPQEWFRRYRSKNRKKSNNQKMLTGSVVDASIKLFLEQRHFIDDISEDRIRRAIKRRLMSSFEKCLKKQEYRIWGKLDEVRAECLKRLENFFVWLWDRIESKYEIHSDWNLAYVYAKPRPGKKLYSKELGICGVPDGFLYEDGIMIPLDYKACDELSDEIRLQMTFYSLLIEENEGKRPNRSMSLLLGSPEPCRMIDNKEETIAEALQLIEDFREKTAPENEHLYNPDLTGSSNKAVVTE